MQSQRVRVTLRLALYRQSVRLGDKPLETHDQQFFFQVNTCCYSPNVTSSLTRGWVCRLQLFLVLASTVILRSESRGTRGHILLPQTRDSPNLEGQVLVSGFSFLGWGWDWVHLVCRALIGLLYQPQMIDDDECGAVGGMRIGKGNRSTRRKPAPVPLCPPQIPHHLAWARTRAAVVGSRRLTAWANARTSSYLYPPGTGWPRYTPRHWGSIP
jgi:hypothetical protein